MMLQSEPMPGYLSWKACREALFHQPTGRFIQPSRCRHS